MADSAVNFVVGRLGEFVVKEAALLQEVGNDVMLLKDKLQWLQMFVQMADHERRQAGGGAYKDVWVQQTREVALEVEDVLDEFMLRVDIEHALPLWNKDDEPRTGFTEESSSLEHMLISGDTKRSIVSIVGESGIGKSTLLRMVLDRDVVKKHFDAHAYWLNLPPRTTKADALCLIYKRVCPSARSPVTEEKIRGALKEYLEGKRYVIVLDGMDKLFNWSSVLSVLPDDDLGSRVVIMDALCGNEATITGVRVLRVPHLNNEESHYLFCRHALGSGNKHLSKSFGSKDLSNREFNKKIMDKVLKITTGFPLAIQLLGRLLRRKEFPDQWINVLNHLNDMERSSRLERILALSFDDLPHSLKLCFLYFSMMPLNINYTAAVLVRRWAAEGFLKPNKGESMEDVGYNYLKELISRGMLNISWKGPLTSKGLIRSVFIHRRLHSMARLETQKGSFLDIYDSTDIPSSAVVRHLFIKNFRNVADIHKDAPFPKLRSLRCNSPEYLRCDSAAGGGDATAINVDQPNHYYSLKHLLRSKLLRVIELRGLQLKKLPRAIGDLVHLRYLCIRSSSLVELPSTIAKLSNLQTLDIQETGRVQKVPQAFWLIPTLRHVLAEKLTLPNSVGLLKNMQTLRGVVVCAHPWHKNKSPLHKMVNLRRLEISGLKDHHWVILLDAFERLESLIRLHLKASRGDTIPITLFTRSSLRHLQLLELHGRIDMLAEGAEAPFALENLSWLLLKSSLVGQDFIDKLGTLPRLAELVLSNEAFQGRELVFSHGGSGFGNLTDLLLRELSELEECKIDPALTKLKKPEVVSCAMMKQ
uniref:NB-ARC domain-containing protein n=1 Tax=Setaria italica TaxID=4555 RepID=K3Y3J1_SETIT